MGKAIPVTRGLGPTPASLSLWLFRPSFRAVVLPSLPHPPSQCGESRWGVRKRTAAPDTGGHRQAAQRDGVPLHLASLFSQSLSPEYRVGLGGHQETRCLVLPPEIVKQHLVSHWPSSHLSCITSLPALRWPRAGCRDSVLSSAGHSRSGGKDSHGARPSPTTMLRGVSGTVGAWWAGG